MDNTDISILSKGKASVSTNNIEVYNKEVLDDEICRLTTTNVQLVIDKIKTEKVKINLETNKVQLFGEKNSLVVKKEELRVEIAALNVAGPFNVPVCSYQDPFLKPTRNKFKAKRLLSFDSLKKKF